MKESDKSADNSNGQRSQLTSTTENKLWHPMRQLRSAGPPAPSQGMYNPKPFETRLRKMQQAVELSRARYVPGVCLQSSQALHMH